MAYLIGQFVGGIIAIYLLMRLVLVAFRRSRYKPESVIAAACMALVIATVLGGYGFGGNGEPMFAASFFTYALPGVFATAIELVRVRRLGDSPNQAGEPRRE